MKDKMEITSDMPEECKEIVRQVNKWRKSLDELFPDD